MKEFKYDRWLIFFIVLGLAAALSIDVFRHRVEENNMTIEMAVDYEGLVELAQMEGVLTEDVLHMAREAGITSLAVYETNLKKLNENGKATATPGADIIKSYGNGTLSDPAWRQLVEEGQITADTVYITSLKPAVFAELQTDLVRRFGEERVKMIAVGGREVVALKANYETVIKQHLGMPEDEMKAVRDAGFYVIARPTNYQDASEDDVQAFFERIAPYNVSSIVFSDKEALGFPDNVDVTARLIRENNYVLGLIEHPLQLQFYQQAGSLDIAAQLDYRAARLYSIPKDEQLKMKLSEAIERWMTTNPERNIRLNLLRVFDKPALGLSLMETNRQYFAEVRDGLTAKGYKFGPAGTYENYQPSRFLLMLITVGATAAGTLYIASVYPLTRRQQYVLFGIVAVILVTPYVIGRGNLVRSVTATASASLFPALAMIWQLNRWRSVAFEAGISIWRIVLRAFGSIFAVGCLSFAGAAYVSSILTDVPYFLEVNIFRGVKLTFVLPLVLVAVAFMRRFSLFEGADYEGNLLAQFKRILNTPVYVKSLLAFALAGIAALIFIGRSGHTAGIPVPGIELKIRAFLEQTLYARPRSKEFLIGHPAFMLTVLAVYRKWPRLLFFVLVMVATIGMGSMVETFAHMRTPVFMSFVRGVNGLVLGSLLGAAAMLGANLLYGLSSYIGRDTAKHE